MRFFLFFSFLFMIAIENVVAVTYGSYAILRFNTQILTCEDITTFEGCLAAGCYIYDGSCHTLPESVSRICNEIVTFGKYSLCLTTDNEILIVIRE